MRPSGALIGFLAQARTKHDRLLHGLQGLEGATKGSRGAGGLSKGFEENPPPWWWPRRSAVGENHGKFDICWLDGLATIHMGTDTSAGAQADP